MIQTCLHRLLFIVSSVLGILLKYKVRRVACCSTTTLTHKVVSCCNHWVDHLPRRKSSKRMSSVFFLLVPIATGFFHGIYGQQAIFPDTIHNQPSVILAAIFLNRMHSSTLDHTSITVDWRCQIKMVNASGSCIGWLATFDQSWEVFRGSLPLVRILHENTQAQLALSNEHHRDLYFYEYGIN